MRSETAQIRMIVIGIQVIKVKQRRQHKCSAIF
jgi:hypothetical protein